MSETTLPLGAEIGPDYVSEDPNDKRCEKCTHYQVEHTQEKDNCHHVMYFLPLAKTEKEYADAGYNVIRGRKLCDCKKFETQ